MATATRRVEFVRPWLYDLQRDAFFGPERYAVCEASTKAGKTTGAIVWLLEQAVIHGAPGRNFWWVAPILGQAEIARNRMKRAVAPTLYTKNDADHTLTIRHNGAIVGFKSADNPDSLYGEDVYAAVIDEGSRCKPDAYYAIRSTLTATRGPLRVIGNVKGRDN